jgi:glycosyltransferase involved in cell wall biosynthesis
LSYFFSRCLKSHFKNNTFKKNIDAYIALSEFSRKKFIEMGLPAGKIFIKPNFLDSGMQEQSDKQDFFLFAGRLADYKGIDTLIEAFKLSGLPLKVIGDGPKHKDVQKKIEGAGNIELLGRLPFREVLDYIRRARCVVFTSECYENMPRVIIESFACGVPVVASDFGATKELVSDRVNGLLFEASNSKSLARKTGFLAKNLELCEKFGIGARAAYEQKFTPDINYKILMDIYRTAGANEEVTAD